MNKRLKIVVAAGSLATLLGSPAFANHETSGSDLRIQSAVVAVPAPVNQIKTRPDTHPELRTGLWQVPHAQRLVVIEAPHVEIDQPPGTVDSPYLMVYNPEFQNALAAMEPTAGTVIVEAAGAERVSDADIESYRKQLEERVRREFGTK
jgi:hypothetical protein